MERKNPSDAGPVLDQSPDTDGEKATEQSSTPNEHSGESARTTEAGDEENKYVTGFKLVIVIIAVTMAAFLMLLDTSIISTVSQHSVFYNNGSRPLLMMSLGYSSYHQRLPFPT
jgi:hypothetical protein